MQRTDEMMKYFSGITNIITAGKTTFNRSLWHKMVKYLTEGVLFHQDLARSIDGSKVDTTLIEYFL